MADGARGKHILCSAGINRLSAPGVKGVVSAALSKIASPLKQLTFLIFMECTQWLCLFKEQARMAGAPSPSDANQQCSQCLVGSL